jgi:hypothetical protein
MNILGFFCFLLTGYLPGYGNEFGLSPQEVEASEKCNLFSDQVSLSFVEKMKKEKQLYAIGMGGGGIGKPGILRTLAISFESYEGIDISRARSLLIYCVEEFLKEINAKYELKRYLTETPFTFKNIDIDIYFTHKKSKDFIGPPSLAVAHADEGVIAYKTYDQEHLTRVKEETYDEALEILRQEKSRKQ